MKWFKRLFGFKRIERSSKEMDHLTSDEGRLIFQTGRCPDCGGGLAPGPSGGLSKNCACMMCGSEFNLTWVTGAVMGERISDRGPRELGDRANLYGRPE
jgi:hypothetical protein